VKVGSSALPAALASLPAAIAPKKSEATAATAAPVATKQAAEDGFDKPMPSWKAALAVGMGVAGFAAGGMLGEQIGMSILRDVVPHISMTAFYAIPLATTLGSALLGCGLATLPFHKGEG
jgi:hypothetical protein